MTWLQKKLASPLLVVCLALSVVAPMKAATYIDSQNLAELTVLPAASSVAGFVAWQFRVRPLSASREVSSIDAASGDFGFSGTDFRQVNPGGQPTVFSDLNGQFGAGDDATTDSQFAFNSGSLLVAPNSKAESSTQLEAAFTGFTPIRVDTGPTVFAQVVTPSNLGGMFSGAIAVRLLSGGTPDVATFSSILFGAAAGDFNSDGFVNGADLTIWSSGYGADITGDTDADGDTDGSDFLTWQRNFTGPAVITVASVPEPSSLGLLLLGACARLLLARVRRCGS